MKKLMMLAAVAAMSFGAHADLLYFLVNSYSPEGPKYNFDYAMVGVAKNVEGTWTTTWGGVGGDEKVYVQVQADGGSWGSYVDSSPTGPYTEAGPAWAEVSDYRADDYAFYIETYSDATDGPIWGFDESTALGYSALLQKGHIYLDSTATPNVTTWAVPEPTSGLLLLFGIAAISLRRKRQRDEVEG